MSDLIRKLFLSIIIIATSFIFLNSVRFAYSVQKKSLSQVNQSQDSLTVVLEKFKTAIIEKDTTNFKKLFFTEKVSFVGIMSKTTEASIKKDYPDFQGISVSNSSKFILEISGTDKSQEERSYNPVIKTDGNIASISFDYSFHSAKRMIQWGHEKWNLVHIEDEWLITDVIYSIHFPDIEPFPFLD